MKTGFQKRMVGLLAGLVWLSGALVQTGLAQAPTFEWITSGGGIGPDPAEAIAVDREGYTYITGRFYVTAIFGSIFVTNGPGIFIAKFDRMGNAVWAAGTSAANPSSGDGVGQGIAVDLVGNTYVAGYFFGTLQFGATKLMLSPADFGGGFVTKLDANGNFLWAKQVPTAYGVVLDSEGSLHVTGLFADTVPFGGTNLTSLGGYDVFHAKYDPAGNVSWVRRAGGLADDRGHAIAADSNGNTYLTGSFRSQAFFGGIRLTNQNASGNSDIFLTKYDRDGNVLWAHSRTDIAPQANGITVDSVGNIFLTGYLNNYAQGFVSKHDPSGNLLWTRNAGDTGNGIAADPFGNCYITGNFSGTTSFGTTNLSSRGESDIFLARYDSFGTLLWAKQAGGSAGSDFGYAVAVDPNGNAFMAGGFFENAMFDMTPVFSIGSEDAFVAKLPAIVPVPPTITSQPQNRMTPSGSNVAFTVNATGTPTLSYLWRLNGMNLLNQTNATLTINNAQLANEGSYRVVVSNTGGSVTSTAATLTIVFPPSITAPPQSQIVTAGTEVSFGVTTTGTLPLSYRWQFNGTNLATGTNALLVLSNAQPANGGSYTVIVTNAYGAVTSSVATLTVRYSLTLNIMGSGTVTRSPALTNFPPNLTVTLSATPSAGFLFAFWSGAASGNTNPLSVLMTTNKSITANFSSIMLTISLQGEGTVSKSPDRSFYNVGEQVTLTATPGRWHGFTRWGDGPTVNPRVITIGASNTYTAIFSPTTAVETLTFNNVSRTAPVGMPVLFVDDEFVVTGAVTRVDAAAVSMLTTFPNGSIFYTLDGSAPDFGGELYSGVFTLRRSTTVRAVAYDANFLEAWEADPVRVIIEPTFAVSATTAGGGLVEVSPGDDSYRSNTLVTLTATPAPGWAFLQWLGDASGTSAVTSVRVGNRDLCAHALFGTTLDLTVAGSGAVVADPAAALYPYGTVARITAVPQSGHYFGAWGNAVMSTDNPLFFPVTTANPTVSCAFGPLNAGQVALAVLVNGRGRVTASPRGNRFTSGASVTFIATAEADQSFLGWTGDASGTATNLTVMLTQSKVITASFTKRPWLALGPCFGGEREAGFQLTLTGEFGGRYEIEQSSGLLNWSPLVSLTNTYGIWQMTDTAATNQATRFYRALEVP